MNKRRSVFQLLIFSAVAILVICTIVFFKHATARPVPGSPEDSLYQTTHGPIAVPDTTFSDSLPLSFPDSLPNDSALLDSLMRMGYTNK